MDPAALRNNERVKVVSSGLMNLGLGLVAAVAVRLFGSMALDLASTIWSIGAAVLIWLSLMALDMLEAEE